MKSPGKRKLTVRILLSAAALILCHTLLGLFPAHFEIWNARIIDQLYLLAANTGPDRSPPEPRVVHVDANFYYTRSVHAEVIRTLAAAGVATQLIDTVFAGRVADAEDLPLIEALSEAPGVLLGISFGMLGSPVHTEKDILSSEESRLLSQAAWNAQVRLDPAVLIAAWQPTVSDAAIAGAADGQGVLNLLPDRDGILRKVPLMVRYRGAIYPSIALLAVCDYLGVSEEDILLETGFVVLRPSGSNNSALPDIRIPVDRHGNLIVDFQVLRNPIRHYSYSLLSEAAQDDGALQRLRAELDGTIAVLSETVDKQYVLPSVANVTMRSSGEILVAVIENLLGKRWIQPLSPLPALAIEIGLLVILLAASLQASSLRFSGISVATAAVYLGLAFLLFDQGRLLLPFVGPLLLIVLVWLFFLATIGVEKAVLFTRTEKARQFAERELEIGRQIQSGFFPTRLPDVDHWELKSYFTAARHVSGDFYDAYTIGEDKKLGVVVADVCDKGVGAALFMALFRSLIRVLSGEAESEIHLNRGRFGGDSGGVVFNVLQSLNRYIAVTHDRDGMFATVFFGILEPATGELHYVNGGHEPAVVLGSDGIKATLAPTGPAVGLDPAAKFKTGRVRIEPGEMLVVYTDGIVDACNKDGAFFTRERLLSLLTASDRSAERLIEKIHTALAAFVHEEAQFDDITLVVLHHRPR